MDAPMIEDEDRRWVVMTVMSALLCFTLPSVFMRVYVRARLVKMFCFDDWVMVVAWLLNSTYIALQIYACISGFGAHLEELPGSISVYSWGSASNGDITQALRSWYLCTIFLVLSSFTVRLTIFLLMLRVHGLRPRPHRCLVLALATTSAVVAAAMFFTLLFQCTDQAEYWSPMRADAERACFKPDVLVGVWYGFMGLTIVVDFGVVGLVGVLVCGEGITAGRRCLLAGLVVLGVAAIAPSAVSILYIPGLRNTADLTYTATNFAICALIPPSLGLTASCLATLDPWLKDLGFLTAQPSYSINWQQDRGPLRPLRPGRQRCGSKGREREMERDATPGFCAPLVGSGGRGKRGEGMGMGEAEMDLEAGVEVDVVDTETLRPSTSRGRVRFEAAAERAPGRDRSRSAAGSVRRLGLTVPPAAMPASSPGIEAPSPAGTSMQTVDSRSGADVTPLGASEELRLVGTRSAGSAVRV